jgi:hypothetical protein
MPIKAIKSAGKPTPTVAAAIFADTLNPAVGVDVDLGLEVVVCVMVTLTLALLHKLSSGRLHGIVGACSQRLRIGYRSYLRELIYCAAQDPTTKKNK